MSGIAACQQAAVAYLNSALSLFDCALFRSGQCRRFHHGLKSNNTTISSQLITPPPSLGMIFRRAAVFSRCSRSLLLLGEGDVHDRCRCIGSTPSRRRNPCVQTSRLHFHITTINRVQKNRFLSARARCLRGAPAPAHRRRCAIAPCMLTIRTKAVTCRNNE